MRTSPKLWKSAVVGSGLLVGLSCPFLALYIFSDYKIYLQQYAATQALELRNIQAKTNEVRDNLKKLMRLTSERIRTAQSDVELIQSIVSSTYRLRELHVLPLLQSISYLKCSSPKMMVTRFGLLPYDNDRVLAAESSLGLFC